MARRTEAATAAAGPDFSRLLPPQRGGDGMVQTFVSQAPQDWRPEYAALPTSVNASARVEASTILDEMLEHARIEDGAVVVPDWALHKAALRIETVRKKGYPCEIDPDG